MAFSVCVFCGSARGFTDSYIRLSYELGGEFVKRGWRLVYGGARVGLMGAIADSVMSSGGSAVGVIPKSLVEKEVAHHGLTDLEIVESMHERKERMYELSDAFLVLPGGFGTLDEFFEILTWKQIGYHQKPIVILNQGGFYDHLLKHLEGAFQAGFLGEKHGKGMGDRGLLSLFSVAKIVQEATTLLQHPKDS